MARIYAASIFESHCAVADQYYRDRLLDSAIVHYRKAAEMAGRFSEQAAFECRSMTGTCLFQLGRLREALAELSFFLDVHSNQTSARTVFHALTHYIQSAQRLPVTLATIDRAYREAEDLLRSTGNIGLRHELLVHRARLELCRGETVEALAAAQEALTLKSISGGTDSGQVWDFHYDGLIDIALSRGNACAAEGYIEEWRTRSDHMPVNRRIRQARCLADLRRFQGRYDEAGRWAEAAIQAALETDYQEVRTAAFRSYIRSKLMLCSLKVARAALADYAKDASGESRVERYPFWVLLGDYYLSVARAVASEPAVDDQFARPGAPRVIPAIPRNTSALTSATRAYRKAGRIGTDIDTKLQCAVRIQEVSDRLARCSRLNSQELDSGEI